MFALEKLKLADIAPLIDLFLDLDFSEIDAVDVVHRTLTQCSLNEEHVMCLMNVVNQKLRVVELNDTSLKLDALRSVLVVSYLF